MLGWEMLCRGVVGEEWIPTPHRRAIECDQQRVVFAKQEPSECHCEVALKGHHTLEETLLGTLVSDFCILLYEISGKPSPKHYDSLLLHPALLDQRPGFRWW